MRLQNYKSVEDYVNEMVITALKVQNAGLKVDDELNASLMLAGLSDEYNVRCNGRRKLKRDAVNKKVQCYNCKLVGHYARNCPSRSNNNNSGNGKSNKNFTHSSSTLLASSVKEFEFCAKTEEKEKCINSNNGVFFYVDSGCSSHMVNDCSLLYDKNILNFEKKLNCQLNALET